MGGFLRQINVILSISFPAERGVMALAIFSHTQRKEFLMTKCRIACFFLVLVAVRCIAVNAEPAIVSNMLIDDRIPSALLGTSPNEGARIELIRETTLPYLPCGVQHTKEDHIAEEEAHYQSRLSSLRNIVPESQLVPNLLNLVMTEQNTGEFHITNIIAVLDRINTPEAHQAIADIHKMMSVIVDRFMRSSISEWVSNELFNRIGTSFPIDTLGDAATIAAVYEGSADYATVASIYDKLVDSGADASQLQRFRHGIAGALGRRSIGVLKNSINHSAVRDMLIQNSNGANLAIAEIAHDKLSEVSASE